MLTVFTLFAMVVATPFNYVEVGYKVVGEDGSPITNAVVTVTTRKNWIPSFSHAGSPMKKIVARTNRKGIAVSRFTCYTGSFDCMITADGYYPIEKRDLIFKRTAGGFFSEILTEYNKELVFKLRKKVHPIPMYVTHRPYYRRMLENIGSIGFDLKEQDFVEPYGTGKISDFELDYHYFRTNGCFNCRGEIHFNGMGNGAYKMLKCGYKSFESVYCADTNITYTQHFPFRIDSSRSGDYVREDILSDREYLILRTRTQCDGKGNIISANYSKIYGPFFAGNVVHIEKIFFNPTVNDVNLEFDDKQNLAPKWKAKSSR